MDNLKILFNDIEKLLNNSISKMEVKVPRTLLMITRIKELEKDHIAIQQMRHDIIMNIIIEESLNL